MLRSHRVVFIAATSLVLAGCSGVKLAYNQLDWFVPQYLEGYVELDGAQSKLLKSQIAEALHWHCGTQLATYATHLREINADFQNDRATTARVSAHYLQIFAYWQAITAEMAPRLATLLAGMSDEQVKELVANIKKQNEKFKAEYVDPPEQEIRRATAKVMQERLERWIGDLTPAQQAMVATWSNDVVLIGPERLRSRERWLAMLQRVLALRNDTTKFDAEVVPLIAHPHYYWNAPYRAQIERLRKENIALLVQIGATLDAAQRKHLNERVNDWAGDFEQLACASKPVQVTSAVGPSSGEP